MNKAAVIFLNGPENEIKQEYIKKLRKDFQDNACVAIDRKLLLNMLNAFDDEKDESYEWVVGKVLKNLVTNGVFVLFNAFLPTRRMQQYVAQMSGLPCYWIGVFFKESDTEFYDFTVELPDSPDQAVNQLTQEQVEQIDNAVIAIKKFIENNQPRCFEVTKDVEFSARKRLIDRFDKKHDRSRFDDKKFDREKRDRNSDSERPAFSKLKGMFGFSSAKKEGEESLANNTSEERLDDNQIVERSERPARERRSFGNDSRGGDRREGRGDRGGFSKPRGRSDDRGSFGSREKKYDNSRGSSDFDRHAWKEDPDLENKRAAFREHAKTYTGTNDDSVAKPEREEGSERRSFGDRKPFGERRSFGDRKPGGERRSFGDRKPFGERRSFGDRQPDGERRSVGDRKPGGERRSFGDRKPFGERRSFGDRQPGGEGRSFGDRKPFGERRSFGDRKPGGEGRSFGDRKPFGERRSFGDRKPGGEGRSFGDRKPFGERKSFGDRKPGGERRSFGGRKPSTGGRSFDRKSGPRKPKG